MLKIFGANLNLDETLGKINMKPYSMKSKGEPRSKTKPDGVKLAYSVMSFIASDKEFDDFENQKIDAIEFLKNNKEDLLILKKVKNIDIICLDFGLESTIGYKQIYSQTSYIPIELIKLCSKYNICIEISIYGF